jgi:hypothetical protein
MEMSPDTLEDDGINELFVVVTVDVSFTTEQVKSSGPLGTHRARSSNSNLALSSYRAMISFGT